MTSTPPGTPRLARLTYTFILLVTAGWASAAGTDTFVLSGATFANGGSHEVHKACFDLSSTIGQPVAGAISRPDSPTRTFSILSGFWGGFLSSSSDSLMRDNFEACL